MSSTTIDEACKFVKNQLNTIPETALVLGSGLGHLADAVSDPVVIEYSSIPGFPLSTVPGHASRIIAGRLDDIPLIVFQGRFHYYEGYDLEKIAFPYRVLATLGCRRIILTNAAGGINRSFKPGDIMLLTDHINFTFKNPLQGPAFHHMSKAYSPELNLLIEKAAGRIGFNLKKGTYGWTFGPSFESAAEIKMMRILGADAVGMSTVPEVISAVDAGMDVSALSCISNMACGILDQPITVEEVNETGREVADKFSSLIREILILIESGY